MATLAAIRTGLQTRLATITGLRCHDVWPDTVNCPAAIVRPIAENFHETFDGDSTITFEVIILALPLANGYARGQDALDPYLAKTGTGSIKVAIDGDSTLGGIVDDTIVAGWADYDGLEVNGVEYLGARITVRVLSH